jgi:hypothetical protein
MYPVVFSSFGLLGQVIFTRVIPEVRSNTTAIVSLKRATPFADP